MKCEIRKDKKSNLWHCAAHNVRWAGLGADQCHVGHDDEVYDEARVDFGRILDKYLLMILEKRRQEEAEHGLQSRRTLGAQIVLTQIQYEVNNMERRRP